MEQHDSPQYVVEVDVPGDEQATELVQELELRDVETARAPGDETTVRIAVEASRDGEPLVLEPLVALEGWLDERGMSSVSVRVRNRTHVVRRRDAA